MLSVYAPTKYHDQILNIIQQADRLEELVTIIDYLDHRPIPNGHNVLIRQEEIFPLIDWHNIQPPFILPEQLPLTAANLLGILFAKLNNYEQAHAYLKDENPALFKELDFVNRLQLGIAVAPDELSGSYTPFDEYRLMHNQAVVRHYSPNLRPEDLDQTKYFYLEAVQAAPNPEYRAFSGRHFASLLTDLGELEDAERLLHAMQHEQLSREAKTELRYGLCQVWMQQLQVPYDEELLEKLKKMLWEVLTDYQDQNRKVEQALVLTDAGIIANYSESWAESLGYFNQALHLFEAEQMPEMAANVQYRKGTLLFTWAKRGNPQFYRTAAESYQKAVKVFTKEVAPEVYAEIQHHLGIIYAEIPDEVKKKSIWAGVSNAAFQEALAIYTKQDYPYEYASICNHYANALTQYPEAKLSDNVEKAIYYYQEALEIRNANEYPLERCLSLLNYLEAQWNLGMPEDKLEIERYEDMLEKAKEVLLLTQDPQLLIEANGHLEKLEFLKSAYA
ncbi:MAG: hypothetical protein MRY78_10995 [Saprospiraceae bacterium]|nr:hypothetical protein [Saprospiraceae bacterium]